MGIFHIALAIFHISGGNISLSLQGKFHWVLGKSFSTIPSGKASGRVPTIDQYILNNRNRKREGYPSWLKNNFAHAIYKIGENLTNLTVISYLHLI
jgi:hypothetical protein